MLARVGELSGGAKVSPANQPHPTQANQLRARTSLARSSATTNAFTGLVLTTEVIWMQLMSAPAWSDSRPVRRQHRASRSTLTHSEFRSARDLRCG